ncbi:hypothetical protein ACQUQU_00600 [Thalassolituus sp. LLYu03]|uniref:hypothetical protein n=1 Tax=Thalassolituus sp. LLYu03 TaxID=3421656 RepID=UPI003D2A4834
MKKSMVAVAGVVAVVAVALLQQTDVRILSGDATPEDGAADNSRRVPLMAASVTVAANSAGDAQASPPDLDNTELEAWLPRLNSDAIASMAQARLQGDARTPPLSAPATRVMPTAAELADEELYQKYEMRQEKRVFRAFVEASQQKVAVIQSYIDQAEAGGISEEEVAFAKEKIRSIQAMADKLQQDNPDLMNAEYQPQESWLPAAD